MNPSSIRWILQNSLPSELNFIHEYLLECGSVADPAKILPLELFRHILRYLSVPIAGKCMRLSKEWHSRILGCSEYWASLIGQYGLMARACEEHFANPLPHQRKDWYALAKLSYTQFKNISTNHPPMNQFLVSDPEIQRGHTSSIRNITFCKREPNVFLTSTWRDRKVWRFADGKAVKIRSFDETNMYDADIDTSLDAVASICLDGTVNVHSISTGELLFSKSVHQSSGFRIVLDGDFLISSGLDDLIAIIKWRNIQNRTERMMFLGYRDSVDIKMHDNVLATVSSRTIRFHIRDPSPPLWVVTHEFVNPAEDDVVSVDMFDGFLFVWTRKGCVTASWDYSKPFDRDTSIKMESFVSDDELCVNAILSGFMRPRSSQSHLLSNSGKVLWQDSFLLGFRRTPKDLNPFKAVMIEMKDEGGLTLRFLHQLYVNRLMNITCMASNRDGLAVFGDTRGSVVVLDVLRRTAIDAPGALVDDRKNVPAPTRMLSDT
ncbi:hypothetical protein HDU97_009009 [Phlyctochytrium planicorne]|nr:hypothetical protein HDU97_009009 [Phlyctochytrium planicorne]